jgi:hypothetical protein
LSDLIDDPAGREGLAEAGRALYLARFSMAAYMQRLRDLYDSLGAQRAATEAAGESSA